MALADAHGVTLRTLRNWKRLDPAEHAASPGRPRLSQVERDEVRKVVCAELDRQGWQAGEEPVFKTLGGRLKRSRVRAAIRELKAARRKRMREHQLAARVSMHVIARDTLWSMDATHLGRDESGREVQGEVVREVASTRTIGLSAGPAATGEDVVRLLEQTTRERSGAPLVLLNDNGGSYRSAAVEAWCNRERVLHLFSLPRTPQHNAASEHGMFELKAGAALGKGVRVHDTAKALAMLERSRDRVDGHRLRASRGWMTAVEADRNALHWTHFVSREEVWMKATCAIDQALLHSSGRRARRLAVREAILATLDHFSVITRTRGGRPWTAHNAEDES